MGELLGRRTQAIWSNRPKDTKGPVLLVFQRTRASAWSVALVKTLELRLAHMNRLYYRLTYLANGSTSLVMLRVKVGLKIGCSVKFLPTLGRLRTDEMLSAANSVLFPIPEWRRICGVPIDPAERMTSFLAVSVVLGLLTPIRHLVMFIQYRSNNILVPAVNSTVRRVSPLVPVPDVFNIRVTLVFRRMCKLGRAWNCGAK